MNHKAALCDLYNKLVTFEDTYTPTVSQHAWIKALKALNVEMKENEMLQVFESINAGLIGNFNQNDWNEWIESYDVEHSEFVNKLKELHTTLLQDINRDRINIKGVCCYQWRVPKYMASQIDLICCGYCRSKSSIFIPYDIIRICMYYFYDNNMIEKFKNSKKGHRFKTGIFDYKSCKFYFIIYPHGERAKHNDEFYWYIEWINKPKNVAEIRMAFKLMLMEKFITFEYSAKTFYDIGDPQQILGNMSQNQLKYDDISYLNSLTFNFCIENIKGYDYNGNEVFYDDVNHNDDDDDDEIKTLKPIIIDELLFESNSFTWHLSDNVIEIIKNTKPKDTVQSGMFIMHNLKWKMWLYPNGDKEEEIGQCHIVIHLISLPIKIRSVSVYVKIMFDQQIISEEELIDSKFTFSELQMAAWSTNILKTTDITSKEKVPSFTISMELIAISNTEGNNVDVDDLQITDINHVESLAMKTFKWKISSALLQQIKHSTSTATFFSAPFKYCCFTFMLELYPNKKCFYGDDDAEEDKPNACFLQLHLLTMPVDLSSISINYSLKLNEITTFSWIAQISNNLSPFAWDDDQVSFIQIKKLNSLTFCCDIQLLDIDFVNNMRPNNINNYINQDIEGNVIKLQKAQYFEWIISKKYYDKNIPTGTIFRNETFIMFGIEWYLWFIPTCYESEEDVHFHICCAYLPKNVLQISCHCKILIDEINFAVSAAASFNDNKMESEYLNDLLPRHVIENLEHITFGIEMTLLTVYDDKGNDVTNIYAEYKDNFEEKSSESNDYIDSYMDDHYIHSYFWEINTVKTSKMDTMNSPFFEMIEQGIEFNMQLCPKNEYENVEIFISIKSIPKQIQRLSIMCGILILEKESQRGNKICNVNLSGAVHFNQIKLKSLLIDSVELELDDAKQITIIINMQPIAIQENK